MFLSHTSITAIFLLFGGLAIAVIDIKSNQEQSLRIVQRPMIGGSLKYNRMGPWPQCEGIEAESCKSLIESMAVGISIEIVNSDFTEREIRSNHVYIYEKDGIVVGIPDRG